MPGFMNGVGEIFNYAFNSLDMTSSANDIIVVQHADGSLHSSPFIVRFGRVKVLRPQDKVVTIEVNDQPTTAVMKIAVDGTAYWVHSANEDGAVHDSDSPLESPLPQSPVFSATSPMTVPEPMPTAPPLQEEEHSEMDPPDARKTTPPPERSPGDSARESPGGVGADVKRLDDALPEEILHDESEKRHVEGLLTSLLAEGSLTLDASPTAAGGGALGVSDTTTPPPSTTTPPTERPSSAAAGGRSPPDDGTLGVGGLRLARLASTDNLLESLPIGHLSLDQHDGAADAAAPAGAAASADPHVQARSDAARALRDALHIDPNLSIQTAESAEELLRQAAASQESALANDDEDKYSESESDDAVRSVPDGVADGDPLAVQTGRMSAEARYTRSVYASHHDLMKLNLQPGANKIRFSTGTTLRGRVDITATVFLWSESSKLIVSDVDGTVTKSDVMGHIATFFGKDWTHPGLCALYSKIAKNGYHFVYLTARSVSQVEQTRQFLFNVEQDGLRLPKGPVLTAPEKLFSALQQELSKKSHEFKIACLTQVREAFPTHVKPFYAGFGNRIGDVVAYTASEISEHKIFIINKDSVIHICSVKRSYRDLSHLVDETFPARKLDDDYLHEYHELRQAAREFNENSAAFRATDGTPSITESARALSADGGTLAERSPSAASDGSGNASAPSFTAAPPAVTAARSKPAAEQAPAEFNTFNFWRVDPIAVVATPAENPPTTADEAASASPRQTSGTAEDASPQAGQPSSRPWFGSLFGAKKATAPTTPPSAPSNSNTDSNISDP